ncbi:MAG: YmfQ family protein [Firmicutes bacterium]|nr:YmfQ family protein [Bacillota bacterium]
MLGYCPRYYENSRVFKSYLQASGEEMDVLKPGVEGVLDQFFVSTATWGLDRWEQELGLTSYTGKPYEQRRSKIISKIRGIGTVTVKLVKIVAEAYDGGTVDVTGRPDQYWFTIRFVDTRGVPPNIGDLMEIIEEIKPAHLGVTYEYRFLIWDELDGLNFSWDSLDNENLTWDQLEGFASKTTMILTGCEQ